MQLLPLGHCVYFIHDCMHALFHLQPSVFILCRKWEEDRVMATDIEIATKLLKDGKVKQTECLERHCYIQHCFLFCSTGMGDCEA